MRILLASFIIVILCCQSDNHDHKTRLRNGLNRFGDKSRRLLNGRSILLATTENFNLRVPSFVILHHTAQPSCDESLAKLTDKSSGVSAHYLICKAGTVYQMVDDHLRSWHSGSSRWGNISDVNSLSIGIELDNSGRERYPVDQLQSLMSLLKELKTKYNIPASNFIGHSDVAPNRKFDPGILFPWKLLARYGFGYMPDSVISKTLHPNFNYVDALRIIGYDISDSISAVQAFRFHFLSTTNTGPLSATELLQLQDVASKYK